MAFRIAYGTDKHEDYFREIGFRVLALRFRETPLDEAFYERFHAPAVSDDALKRELVGMPEDVHFVCVLTIGHPSAEGDDAAQSSRLTRRRVPLDDLVSWDG